MGIRPPSAKSGSIKRLGNLRPHRPPSDPLLPRRARIERNSCGPRHRLRRSADSFTNDGRADRAPVTRPATKVQSASPDKKTARATILTAAVSAEPSVRRINGRRSPATGPRVLESTIRRRNKHRDFPATTSTPRALDYLASSKNCCKTTGVQDAVLLARRPIEVNRQHHLRTDAPKYRSGRYEGTGGRCESLPL